MWGYKMEDVIKLIYVEKLIKNRIKYFSLGHKIVDCNGPIIYYTLTKKENLLEKYKNRKHK